MYDIAPKGCGNSKKKQITVDWNDTEKIHGS